MAVNVEYVIKLNDQLTRKLKVAQTQVDKLNNKVTQTKSSFAGLGGLLARVGAAAAIGMAAKAIVTLGANMEQTRVAFATFLGDAEKANVLIAQLNEFANVTPFNNDEIIKSGRLLLAAGIPAEKITDTLKQIGDVAAGANVPITELAAIFQKATNKGKLQAEELNQFAERGIPILDELSKMFGKSKEEVLKLGSQGKITSAVMNTAFSNMTSEGGIFFNLMEKQSATLGGRFSTLIGKLQTVGIAIGEALIPVLGVLTDFAISIVEGGDALGDLIIVVGGLAVAMVALNAATIAAAFSAKLLTIQTWLLNAAEAANPIGIVIAAIAAFVAVVMLAWRHSETFRGVILGLWEAIKVVGLNVYKFLIEPFTAFKDLLVSIFTLDFDGFIDAFKRLGKSALTYILQPLLQIAKVIDKFAGTDLAGSIQSVTGITDLTAGVGKAFGEGFEKGKDKEEDKEASLTGSGSSLTTKSGAGGTGAAGGSGALGAKVSEVKANAPKVFNINIEKLVEALNISTTNLKDSSTRIKEEVERALLTAITDASIISE